MSATMLFDTNTLWNFAVVERLPLLETRFAGRAGWTEAVAQEVEDNSGRVPGFEGLLDNSWLGAPIEFTPQEIPGVFAIQRILAAPGDGPTKHLGEAELIYAMENRLGESALVTDDGPAADLARKRGHLTRDSKWVLSECHSMYEIGCPEAYEVLQQMKAAGRGVDVPANHTAVC